ncbi:hypothetical protein ACTPEM_25875, partial [Clostridioides difficile]
AIASFLYLGVCLGSGPRDGLMIALQKKTNKSVRLVRTILEILVCLGSGPRDGLMIALQKKTNKSVRLVRTILEILALVVGWLLG